MPAQYYSVSLSLFNEFKFLVASKVLYKLPLLVQYDKYSTCWQCFILCMFISLHGEFKGTTSAIFCIYIRTSVAHCINQKQGW